MHQILKLPSEKLSNQSHPDQIRTIWVQKIITEHLKITYAISPYAKSREIFSFRYPWLDYENSNTDLQTWKTTHL